MRLRLFDRIRRLTRRRRPARLPDSEFSGGAQGRHRRAAPESPDAQLSAARSRHGSPAPAPVGRRRRTCRRHWRRLPALAGATGAPPGRTGRPLFPRTGGLSTREHRTYLAPGVPADGAGRRPDRAGPAVFRFPGRGGSQGGFPEAPGPAGGGRGHGAVVRGGPARSGPRPGVVEADARPDVARAAPVAPRQHGNGRSLRAAGAAPARQVALRGAAFAGAAAHRGRPQELRLDRADPVAPVGHRGGPPAEVIEAVDRLAELPEAIKERLAEGLDAIFIGPGGVPELDDMTSLQGVPLPGGRATWDACAGAYGERKIVVGTQPSPTPDVMCHEVGHALDDLDSPAGKWQSDSAEFRMLYDQCQPHLASDFHRQPGGLGRKEFFADAFAAIASRQRPALVDMLSGDTRTALGSCCTSTGAMASRVISDVCHTTAER